MAVPIKLNVGPDSKNIPESMDGKLFNLSYNGIEIEPKSFGDFPMPWEAFTYIENGMFILRGDLGQQGSHRGYSETGIPLDRVSNYLDIQIVAEDEEAARELEQIFREYNWL